MFHFQLSLGGSEGGKDCAFKKKDDTQWEKFECIKSEKFLCMVETVVLVQEEKNWEEALQHCRSLVSPHGTGTGTLIHNYDLVSLLTADDHNYARKIAQAATTDEVVQLSFLWCERPLLSSHSPYWKS